MQKPNQPQSAAQMRAVARAEESFAPNRRARRAAGIQAIPPWTACASRLPPVDQQVLVWGDDLHFAIAEFHELDEDGIQVWYVDGNLLDDPDCNPSHWMPLPAKPEGE